MSIISTQMQGWLNANPGQTPQNYYGAMGIPHAPRPPVRTPVANYQAPAEIPPKQPAAGYQTNPNTPYYTQPNGAHVVNGQWVNPNQPQGSAGSQGGQANIQTNISPSPIYTPNMTQLAVNQAVADNTPDLRNAMKAFDRPGVSRSAGTVAAAMPTVAASQLAQREAAATIPMLDEIANQKHQLAGEVAREQQALEMGNLLNRLNQTRQQQQIGNAQNQLGQLGNGLSLLQSLLG